MAQTIAVQRGSTTVLASGSTSVTLFTLSSGTATRVILNSVSCVTTNGGSRLRMALMINSNGTGNLMPVAFQFAGTSSTYTGMTMFPGNDIETVGNPRTQPATGATTPDGWVVVSQTQGPVAVDLSNGYAQIRGPQNASYGDDNFSVAMVPKQFWMNSGDSLVFRCRLQRTAGTENATVIYSFTTVTES